ncbi:hypothetical protein [Cetobacterium sp.]
MKNSTCIKYIAISFFLTLFFGCSAIMTSIGNNKISSAINIYNSHGITTDGTVKLISGLEYSPESQLGILQYQKQYFEITGIKNRILKNKYFTKQDLNTLNLYLLTVEEFKKIQSKFPTITVDYNDFNKSKVKITKIFEDFVLKDEKIYINRSQKIQNIDFYKKINTYINSYIINSAIFKLEGDVTVNLYINSSFRGFSQLDYLLTDALRYAADMNINRNLGNYVIFRGFNSFPRLNSKNYLIDFNFSNIYVRTLETKEVTREKEKIFTTRKKVTVSGYYKIYTQSSTPSTRHFEFNENYTLRMREYDSSTFYDDERDIIKKILEDKFSNVIRYDLNNLIY